MDIAQIDKFLKFFVEILTEITPRKMAKKAEMKQLYNIAVSRLS